MCVSKKACAHHPLNQPSKAKTGSWYHKITNIAFVARNGLISPLNQKYYFPKFLTNLVSLLCEWD